MKILIVDDQPVNVFLLKILLQNHGYEVISASNGVEALEKAVQDRCDLIVSDILLPQMDGFQLCREVKTHPQLHDIAFVFYSALYTDAQDHAFALSLGADHFLVKPEDPHVVLAAVQEVLRRRTDGKPVTPLSVLDEVVYMQGHTERLSHRLAETGLELEEAYRRLAQSEAHYRALVEQASDAIVLFDAHGQVSLANAQFSTWFGYGQADVPGLPLRGLLHPDEVDRVLGFFQSLMAGERLPALGEVTCLTNAGALLYMDLTVTRIVRDGTFMGVQAILRDVAVGHHLRTALAASERRYRRLFETAQDGILLLEDGSGRITDVNPYLATLLKRRPEELLGKELWEIGVFEDQEASKAAFATLQREGYIRYEHLPLVTSEGHHIAVEFVSNVYTVEAQPVIQCNIRDITARYQLETALATSEQRYRRLFETAQDGILLLEDESGRITDVNPYLATLLKRRPEEFLGKELWEIGVFKDQEASKAAFATLQREGYIRYEHLPLVTSEGHHIAVEFVSNVYTVEAQPVIQCNIRDITARHQLETALATSEQRYRRLFETAQDGILLLEDGSGWITDVNPFLATLLGRRPEELLGKELWEIGVFEDREASQAAFATVQREGSIRYEHLPLVTHDGRHIAVECVSNVYSVGAQRVIQCNIRDITARSQLETALAQEHAELLRVNLTLTTSYAEIQRFYHTVSHELKTPLTSLREFVAILLDGLAGPLADQQRAYLEIAKESCDQMTRGLNDLLDTTRADTGKLSVVLHPMALGAVVERAVMAMELTAHTKGVRLRQVIAPQLPAVALDAQRMTQVLLNLLSNAVKFTAAGGEVAVAVHPAPHRPSWVQVQVRDTGCGIASEHCPHIFDRLYQVPEADPLSTNGMGLGLYISQELVTRHGGLLEVQSQLGHGSTFTFSLPTVEEPASPSSS